MPGSGLHLLLDFYFPFRNFCGRICAIAVFDRDTHQIRDPADRVDILILKLILPFEFEDADGFVSAEDRKAQRECRLFLARLGSDCSRLLDAGRN